MIVLVPRRFDADAELAGRRSDPRTGIDPNYEGCQRPLRFRLRDGAVQLIPEGLLNVGCLLLTKSADPINNERIGSRELPLSPSQELSQL